MNDHIAQFRNAIVQAGLPAPTEIVDDGKVHRFSTNGAAKNRDGFYTLHGDGIPAGAFGCWRTDLKATWCAKADNTMTPEEREAHRQRAKTMQGAREAEQTRRHSEAATEARIRWDGAKRATQHEYLRAKGVKAHGLRVDVSGALLVPMHDTAGKLYSLQFIGPDGTKRFMAGGRVHGCYHAIGKPDGTLIVCEGYATGASIHKASGHAVAVAFSAVNLTPVTLALHAKYPKARIIVAADDDCATPSNPGITNATAAARAAGVLLAVPDFGPDRKDAMTDFNDLQQYDGDDAVRKSIEHAKPVSGNGDARAINSIADNERAGAIKSVAADAIDGAGDATQCAYGSGLFELKDGGVYFIGRETAKELAGQDKAARWICSPVSVVAATRDTKSAEWGRLLEWQDADGVRHQWAMPLELLQGDGVDVRKELARLGVRIAPSRTARELLTSYIQVWPAKARARCVNRLGWHGAVYVVPGRSIGETEAERVVFQNAHGLEPAFSVAGTADSWRNSVARLAQGNSRVVFALSMAFAAPLADLVNEDSGGFHLRGTSSIGKSTSLNAAGSVWGNPKNYCRLWRTTTNGLEGLAALHNDGLLVLDELKQVDPKEAGEAAYLLANGQGKTRATRNGAPRQAASWRLLFLSAGEISLSAHTAQIGRKATAGQEVRLAEIEADAGAELGAFEALHECASPKALAQAFKDAATLHHGAAGVAWLEIVVRDRDKLAEIIAEGMRQFVEEYAPVDAVGQVLRVAQRFGLVAVAGELATHYGLTGWPEGEAGEAVGKCFSSWLESFGGTGNWEERALRAQVRAFFETHGSSRFENKSMSMTMTTDQRIINRAGFYETGPDGTREFLVFPEAFEREVCAGFDLKMAKRHLIAQGWITPDGNRATQKPRLPGMGSTRVYVFTNKWAEGE